MKCFTHAKKDAVAQCACGKGVCGPCAIPSGDGVCCPSCAAALIQTEIGGYRKSLVSAWSLTAVGTLAGIVFGVNLIGVGEAGGLVAFLLGPAAGWCVAWGWGPTKRVCGRFFGGLTFVGGVLFVAVAWLFVWELVILAAMVNGLFTGLRKYRQARDGIRTGEEMLVELRNRTVGDLEAAPGAATVTEFGRGTPAKPAP